MFSKSKHAIGKKCKKVMTAALTFALLCGFTGCAKEETGGSAPQSTVARSSSSVKQNVPNNNSEVSQSSAVSSDNTVSSDTQSEQSAVKTEFDFDEAVKNISLFGHKISLPCYWSDFDKDFSHDEIYIKSDDDLMCGLLYKEKKVGNIFFGNSADSKDTNEIEKKPIICIILGFTSYEYPYTDSELEFLESRGYYTDPLEFGMGNLSMTSKKNDIIAELGEPSVKGGNVSLTYKYDNGYFTFYLNNAKERKDRIVKIYICVYSN